MTDKPTICIDMSEPDWIEVQAWASESGSYEILNDPVEEIEAQRIMVKYWIEQWKKHHTPTSFASKMAEHPAYQKIIEIGEIALPLIFDEMKRDPDHWFIALHEITGANPVPESSRGKLQKMTEAWLLWGEKHGYVKEEA